MLVGVTWEISVVFVKVVVVVSAVEVWTLTVKVVVSARLLLIINLWSTSVELTTNCDFTNVPSYIGMFKNEIWLPLFEAVKLATLTNWNETSSTEEVKTQPLGKWLDEVSAIPKDEFIFITRDNTSKKVGAVSKQVYQLILNGENIDDLFNENDKKKAIDGFVTYLATEKLGDEVLKVLDSPMGSVEDHEGVVIRDEKIASVPFKITGKFILGGLISDF